MRQVSVVKTECDHKAQTVTLCFEEKLPEGEVQLLVKFDGSINDKLAGLYRSKYTVRWCIPCGAVIRAGVWFSQCRMGGERIEGLLRFRRVA